MSIPAFVLPVAAAAVGSLFAMADAALTSLPEVRLQTLVEKKERAFLRFSANRQRLFARWLVLRVLCISTASVLVARALDGVLGLAASSVISVFASVLTYGTFTEILGTIARRRPEAVGRLALRYLTPFEWIVFPIAEPLATIGNFVGARVPEDSAAKIARITEDEVEWLVAQSERAGTLEKEPATMIRNVFDFRNLTAREVMIPRRHVSSLEVTLPLGGVFDHVIKRGHSRYPVYRESLDNVVGLLYVKDLFEVVRENKLSTTKLEDLIRKPALFIAESQPALSVLREMRSLRFHLAIVSDEFGGTSGIVTLEDIIEEIVGEIHDEYDTDETAPIQKLADGRFVADAAISIGDLEAHLGGELSEDGDFESLGGLIIHRAGRVPEVGTTLELDGYNLIVREANETHVIKVEIVRASAEVPTP